MNIFKSKLSQVSLFIIFLFLVFSCKKKNVEANLTNLQKVARTWECDQAEIIASKNVVIYKKGSSGNILELKDSFVKFNADGTFSGIDFNAIPQTGTWKFKNDDKVAELDSWDYDFEIVNLSKTSLTFNTKVDTEDRTYDIFVKMIPKL
jgi:hypothetical protein